jgi:hypothetical protein
MDSLKPAPKMVSIQVDSVPQGADATSSLGPTCKTPCTLSVPDNAESFSVAFALPNYQPLTVPVTVTRRPGESIISQPTTVFDPDPVIGELQAEPPKRPARRHARKRHAAPKPAAPAPAASSAFPAPQTTPPPARQ